MNETHKAQMRELQRELDEDVKPFSKRYWELIWRLSACARPIPIRLGTVLRGYP